LEDGVSSREDMDTAMRLGTNYPLGPFEWANRLGKKEISTLLQILAQNDTRCQPAPLLIQEATI
jgi:3-hydroxybutyryl-CoA dehydrogenase